MINGQELLDAIYSITDEKRIDKAIIFEGIKEGFQKAYEKFFDPEAIIRVDINEDAGQINVFKELTVASEIEDEWLDILLDEAKAKYGDDVQVGDHVYEPVEFTDEFSRLAILHVGQIIKQKIREGEKQKIYEEFIDREHKIVHGEIKDITETSYLVSVDGSIIPIWNKKMIPGESFNIGQRIAFYIENISKDDKHSQVQGTRVHPQFLQRLLEEEIPEIREGSVVVKAVSREPGRRAKVAVYSNDPLIDPIGACVGANGQRVKNITSQLNGEKIDVILWSEDKMEFIINATAPVRVISIEIDSEEVEGYHDEQDDCTIVVPNEQLSLAIGRQGMSSRLVANLVGIKVNIFSYDDAKKANFDIHWNGNITEEELTSPEFLQNINRRKNDFNAAQRANNVIADDASWKRHDKVQKNDDIDEAIFVQDTSIDEIQENISAFENLTDNEDDTKDFGVDDLDEDYDEYYE